MQCENGRQYITVGGKKAYAVERLIGRGGTAECYLSRRVLADGSLSPVRCVVKQFCPKEIKPMLEERGIDGQWQLLTELAGLEQAESEIAMLRDAFRQEARLCDEVNGAAGGGSNFPWILHSQSVPGRDDLLEISTESGMSLRDYMRAHRSETVDKSWLLLSLQVVSMLLDALEAIHKKYLHLDIKPENIYLVSHREEIGCGSAFAVKLFDLATACEKAAFAPDAAKLAEWKLRCAYTAPYASPEMHDLLRAMETGRELNWLRYGTVDERADWYSVGQVLYEMLCGMHVDRGEFRRRPFALPEGVLAGDVACDAVRVPLEALLARVLELQACYTRQDVEEGAFRRDVQALIDVVHALPGENEVRVLLPAREHAAHGHAWQGLLVHGEEPAIDAEGWPNGALIRSFSREERAVYERQQTVLMHDLPGAQDQLSSYTCHSIPHVEEVMAQCDAMFTALTPWLTEEVGMDGEALRRGRIHLLLAAKFHDIGMCGTDAMAELLGNVDAQEREYPLRTPMAKPLLRAMRARMRILAEQAEREPTGMMKRVRFTGSAYNGLCALPVTDEGCRERLLVYHEEIKNNIRSTHGESSARWVAEHQEELAARYGTQIDWHEVALLAALHTGFVPFTDALPMTYAAALTAHLHLIGPDLTKDSERLRIFALAAILRLSDQRRNGSTLRTLDGKLIVLTKSPAGRLRLDIQGDDRARAVSTDVSYRILLSEKLCEFGPVGLEKRGAHWVMLHEMHLSHQQLPDMPELFVRQRLRAYGKELQESLFQPGGKLRHVLVLRPDHAPANGLRADAVQISMAALLRGEMTPELRQCCDMLARGEICPLELNP